NFEAEGVSYSDSIPKPEEVTGHQIGSRHTRTDQVVKYFETIGGISPRVKVKIHGRTYEGRPLIHAIVTSPENQKRIDQLREANLRLTTNPAGTTDADLAQMPVFVNMGYSVHGNEASGTEAALLLLYHLAAGNGAPVESILDNVVVVIDPMLNPDGRARFVGWVNSNRGRVASTDPNDREHIEPWPGGRTNHYWFDLNRDWLLGQLVESQGRLELFHHWRPQLQTDFHEMGSQSTFFFQPGVPERNNPNTPERTHTLTREVANYHAEALDRIGSLYYSEETFDDFYFGKGSSYPDINGAIGILFEQATSRSLRREIDSGILDYSFTIRNQLAGSFSSLKAAVEMREKLLRNQRDFYLEAEQLARDSSVRAYIIQNEGVGRRALPLVEVLLRHQIQVFELAKGIEIETTRYQAGKAYIVPTVQPQSRLLKALMERVTEFNAQVFYDVSTWTLPLAFGVEAAEFKGDLEAHAGKRINAPMTPTGSMAGNQAKYGYLVEWENYLSPRALYRLQQSGITVRLLKKPAVTEVDGIRRTHNPGTLIVPVNQLGVEPEVVHETVAKIVETDGATVVGVSTGLTLSGPDLGSPSSTPLEIPKIALLSGDGVQSSQIGEAWFQLNERIGVPVSLLDERRVGETDLSRYNTLILAGGSHSNLLEDDVEKLKGWMNQGGLLIVIHEGVKWAVSKELVDEKLLEIPKDTTLVQYADVGTRRRSQSIPGSIFRAHLDPTHPVAFGLGQELDLLRNHEIALELSKTPGANVAVYSDAPLISGYSPDSKVEILKGTPAIVARKMDQGAIILFLDDPNFRAFWYSTSTLFHNAVFFGRAF
ncbi:MAG TPA: M14 family metallopeptidase, partial [Acidobacteriota bacterium]|nr:M14 family metallopeptidase [Acidobacteriota bacterium]